jgi:GT2 family glycosyltransferase
MEGDTPIVSIITSLYDGDKYIYNFLKNITSQSIFQKCELIIIDANSPGTESKVIQSFQKDYDNIFYDRLESDPGIYGAWNIAIKKSRGKYITNANLDDLRLNNHIEKCIEVLEKNNQIDLVSTGVYVVDENSNFDFNKLEKYETWFTGNSVPTYYNLNDMLIFKDKFWESRNPPHNAPVWRKNLHSRFGFFNEGKFKYAADFEFWLRCLNGESIAMHLNIPLAVYRVVKNSHNRRNRYNHNELMEKLVRIYKPTHLVNNIFSLENQVNVSYGKHRSGWSYVIDNLAKLGNNEKGLVFSSFIERDFGWGFSGQTCQNMIRRGWVGIAHAPHNYPEFIGEIVNQYPEYYVKKYKFKSLWKRCRGLFTLSEYVANEWRRLLPNVKIEVLTHPTEVVTNKFTFTKYQQNNDKQILQIGYWLRKLGSIMKAETNGIKKTIISPEISYFIPHISKIVESCIRNELDEPNFKFTYGQKNFGNNKLKFEKLCDKYNVNLIEKVSNEKYDNLLSENIVLFDFYDISASNLLVECIVRNTPMIIKRHPAVIEYIGEEYPLYFENLSDVSAMITSEKIKSAYGYLCELDKSRYTINKFLRDFMDSEIVKKIRDN